MTNKLLNCSHVVNAMRVLMEGHRIAGQQRRNVVVDVLLPTFQNGKAMKASASYVSAKRKFFETIGMELRVSRLALAEDESGIEQLRQWIAARNSDDECDGLFVQLPIASRSQHDVAVRDALRSIVAHKDVDALSGSNRSPFVGATTLGILSLLDYFRIDTVGKHVVLLGKGQRSTTPLVQPLSAYPYYATVTQCDAFTNDLHALTRSADIIVTATGAAHSLRREHIRAESVLIDVGIARINDAVVGDVEPSCYEVASAYTVVPGGVGQLTVASLAVNAVNAVRFRRGVPLLDMPRMLRGMHYLSPHSPMQTPKTVTATAVATTTTVSNSVNINVNPLSSSSTSTSAFYNVSNLPNELPANVKVVVCTIDDNSTIALSQLALLRNVVVIGVLQSNYVTSAQLKSALLCDLALLSVADATRLFVDNRHNTTASSETTSTATAAAGSDIDTAKYRENELLTERVGTIVWASISQTNTLREIALDTALALRLFDDIDALLARYASNSNDRSDNFESKLARLVQLIASDERAFRSLKEYKSARLK